MTPNSSDTPEETLRQVQSDYDSLIDSLPICLLRKDIDGNPVFANRLYLEFHGTTPDELPGRSELQSPGADADRFQREDR
ncbi:MAG: PAS domain-containing protein, partial [Planctomycetaceae bacterium]|nr:PAS domain-containing protein [Planctomycetaceae bacterium]